MSRRGRQKGFLNLFYQVVLHLLIIFLAFIIQTSIFPMIPLFNTSPNLLLIITFSYGLLYSERIGILTGVICGLLFDMYFNGEFGFYILIYSLIGYFNGRLNSAFYNDTITLPLVLSLVNGFSYNFYIYFTHFFIRRKFNLIYYFFNLMLPNVLFTLIVTVVLYKFLYYFNIIRVGNKLE